METLSRNWGWLLALGVLMIALGVLAIGAPPVATVAVQLVLGWILVIGGIAQGVHAFMVKGWGGFLLQLLSAALYLVVGILLVANPVGGALALTIVLAIFLIAEGVFKARPGLPPARPSRLGLAARERAAVAAAGDPDLVRVAGLGPVGDRPPGWHPAAVHRLVAADGGPRRARPCARAGACGLSHPTRRRPGQQVPPRRQGMNGETALDPPLMEHERVRLFEQHRRRLRGLAYRMLGTVGDAEDVTQEAYLRWHRADLATIGSAEAWLVATTTRLAIDRLRAVAAERRAYAGPWLPAPWLDPVDDAAMPDRRLERAADLSVAFLLLLERLSPEERAAFLLREVFEVAYAEIAGTLGRTEAACRQLVHRARARLRAAAARPPADPHRHQALLDDFLAAIGAGDQNRLLALLAPDAVLMSDGGGKVLAARNPIAGAERIARFLLGLARKQAQPFDYEPITINGAPGVVRRHDGRVNSTLAIAGDGATIRAVYIVLNPDKLRHLGAGASGRHLAIFA